MERRERRGWMIVSRRQSGACAPMRSSVCAGETMRASQVPNRECGCVHVCVHGWLVNSRCARTLKKKCNKKTLPICFKRRKFKATTLHKWEEMQHKDNISARNSGHGLKQSKRTGQWKLIYFLRPLKCRLMAFQMPAGNHLGAHVVYCCGESEMHFNI